MWFILYQQETWGSMVIKQELEDDEMIQDHGVCSDK
jgi:hypothetical protein